MPNRRLNSAYIAAGILALSAGLPSCDGGSDGSTTTRSRVDVVLADEDQGVSLEAFCEVSAKADAAKTFQWPELDGDTPATGDGWTWVCLWATWCKPCIEEMPMMARWQDKLREQGLDVTIQYVSVDAADEDLTKYRSTHADAPDGPRVKDQAAVTPWLTTLGLDEGAAIPIHVFVDAQRKIRCVRVGALSEPDYRTVEYLIRTP